MSFAQRIQRNPILLLGVGVVLIAVAIALIWLNLSAREATPVQTAMPRSGNTLEADAAVGVLVASRSIPRGQAVSSSDVVLRRMAGPAPAGSFSDPTSVVGRVATVDIRTSQIVFQDNLSADPAASGIAALVPEGQRAFAIRVAEEDIVGGFLQAGDRVDVFVTLPDSVYGQRGGIGQREGDRSKSTLLLQDMQVLAVGPELSPAGTEVQSGARTVSVAAPPEALARLALAGRLGHITLAIRNPSDRETSQPEVVALEDLRPDTSSVASSEEDKAEAATQGHRITIYSGASQTTVTAPR